jgi:hypothetical protein
VAPDELAGVTEVAKILGVAKRTAAKYVDRPDFPKPLDVLSTGRVWRYADVERWGRENLPLRTGRPLGPQVPAFLITTPAGRREVSVNRHQAKQLDEQLRRIGTDVAIDTADRIVAATQLPTDSTLIEVRPGVDDALLRALDGLEAQGETLGQNLGRLQRALAFIRDA